MIFQSEQPILQKRTLDILRFAPLGILVTTTVIFCLGAFRGFEITDESFYFLHYLYSREFFAGVSFFGLYFELPFYLLNSSISAIRIFGMCILISATFYFSLRLYSYCFSDQLLNIDKLAFISTSITGVFLYYGYFSTLNAPSYNLLVLLSMLLSTGVLFAILENDRDNKKSYFLPIVYGFLISVCVFTKAPSSFYLVVSHVLFYFIVTNWNIRRFSYILVLSLVGFVVNLAVVQLFFPDWFAVIIRGIKAVSLTDGRDVFLSFRAFSWDIQRSIFSNWITYLIILGCYIFSLLMAARYKQNLIGLIVLSLFISLISWINVLDNHSTLYPIFFIVLIMLFLTIWITQNKKPEPSFVALITLLFLLPIGYSWGTNMSIADHSRMALIFPLSACLILLKKLNFQAVITRKIYLFTLVIACLPTFWFQIVPWFNLDYTYRLNTPLIEQKYPISIGNPSSTIFVDAVMRDDIVFFSKMLSSVNFEKGTPILDLTGDGVGFVYAAGGKPVGMGWLLGGYPGSEKTFEYLIDSVDKTLLKSSWLMTSDDNPRHIKNWQTIWLRKLGELNHQPVGTVCLHWPYVWSSSSDKNCYEITLWKPIAGVR